MKHKGRYAFFNAGQLISVKYQYDDHLEEFTIISKAALSKDQYDIIIEIMAQDLQLSQCVYRFSKHASGFYKLGYVVYTGSVIHWQDLACHWREDDRI